MNIQRKYIGLVLLFLGAFVVLPAQQLADSVYWVYFTDKNGNGYQVDQPLDFLSERSVHRRAWQGLAVDETDLPVTEAYLTELRQDGIQIRHVSRWLNGIAFVNADSVVNQQVLAKPFTTLVPWEADPEVTYSPPTPGGDRFEPPLDMAPGFQYGVAREQIEQLHMQVLHELGYTGKGVYVAALDAGFRNVDSLPSFETMISEGRLLGTRNFVDTIPIYRQWNGHGMYILSLMGAEWDGFMVGTAPHASYYLCMTENPNQETRIEEIAWIEAAEFVDSMGFDVINTSLGYSDFDGTAYDYTYNDMDGNSTFISRAASKTAAKGIIACNSAGNSGDDPWFYITAPADAYDILAVGALDSMGVISGFSSRGPSFDSRTKPDVSAMGVATGLQSVNGGLARGGGTSFSSPLIAGSVASLWQAYPEMSALEVMAAVRESGNRRNEPDDIYGYGIPDFASAFWTINRVPATTADQQLKIYPNPASTGFRVRIPEENSGILPVHLYDLGGRRIHTTHVSIPGFIPLPESLSQGIYVVEIITLEGTYRGRLMKE